MRQDKSPVWGAMAPQGDVIPRGDLSIHYATSTLIFNPNRNLLLQLKYFSNVMRLNQLFYDLFTASVSCEGGSSLCVAPAGWPMLIDANVRLCGAKQLLPRK